MANQRTAASKHGATRGKLILIGVLTLVLIFVVYWNYFRDGSPPADDVAMANRAAPAKDAAGRPRPTTRAATPPAPPPQSKASDAEPAGRANEEPWPEFELAEVVSRDPFALPQQFPQPPPPVDVVATPESDPDELESLRRLAAAQEQAAALADIRQKGVNLIYRSGNQYVARIGDQEVRVGDEIGGFRVVDISLQGVKLEGVRSP